MMSDSLRAEQARLMSWLFEDALPFWSQACIDHEAGGFFERITPEGVPIRDPRRARVVGRQIYCFATALRLGWQGPAKAGLDHSIAALSRFHLHDDGLVVPTVDGAGRPARVDFDLYDHAFTLFGLAAAARAGQEEGEDAETLTVRAVRLRAGMQAGFAHPSGGFDEGQPRKLPLASNPHMHLMEAGLAWADVAPGHGWDGFTDEIGELALARFVDTRTGAVREYFGGDWEQLPDVAGSVVEPGHQFEWAWLLARWGLLRKRADALDVSRRLIALGEANGIAVSLDLAVNELNADLTVRDARARLWPQTERIKAHLAAARTAADGTARAAAEDRAADAARGLARFLRHPIPGMWWEHIAPDGVPASEPARTSSLYHIICALDAIATYSEGGL